MLNDDFVRKYVKPLRVKKTKFTRLFFMRPRIGDRTPGRALHVAFDTVLPLIPGFVARYIYWVHFYKAKGYAGNHFHYKKQELFYPLRGNFTVYLEHPTTHKKETIRLEEKQNHVLFIPTPFAHTVVAEKSNALLLVIANSANANGDMFPYTII